jgi:hypothetical protein
VKGREGKQQQQQQQLASMREERERENNNYYYYYPHEAIQSAQAKRIKCTHTYSNTLLFGLSVPVSQRDPPIEVINTKY